MQPGSVTVTWANPLNIVYGRALGALQLNAVANVPGAYDYSPTHGAILNAGNGQVLSVVFTPHDLARYSVVTQSVTINVLPATPLIVWPAPTNIVYGTALGAAQLNAVAGIAGTFTYSPNSNTILNAGVGQVLSVSFSPADRNNYLSAAKSVAIDVLPATPIITWRDPAPIDNGTPLGPVQLNAIADVPGSFVYSPAAGVAALVVVFALFAAFAASLAAICLLVKGRNSFKRAALPVRPRR